MKTGEHHLRFKLIKMLRCRCKWARDNNVPLWHQSSREPQASHGNSENIAPTNKLAHKHISGWIFPLSIMNLLQFKHQHFSTMDSNHDDTPRKKRTQLEASHLPTHSQRGTQAGEDKNATCLRRRQEQQTHQRMFISTSNTDYTIPWARTASSWAESLDPPPHSPPICHLCTPQQFPLSLSHSVLNPALGFNWLSACLCSIIIYKTLYDLQFYTYTLFI